VIEPNQSYSCPRNPRGIPTKVNEDWASHCGLHKLGKPKRRRVIKDDGNSQIFFTSQFGVRVTPDYRSIVVVAKNGYELKIDPSQSSEQKIVVTSLKEEEETVKCNAKN